MGCKRPVEVCPAGTFSCSRPEWNGEAVGPRFRPVRTSKAAIFSLAYFRRLPSEDALTPLAATAGAKTCGPAKCEQ